VPRQPTTPFGNQVRKLRTKAGLTRAGLALKSGVSASAIRDIENGTTTFPQWVNVEGLAGAFGLTGQERTAFLAAAPRRAKSSRAVRRPPAPIPAVRALPGDVVPFTGRLRELARLRAAVARGLTGSGPRVVAINGLPGIGKTTLAVHLAHQVAGEFPGGQVFLELHGHDPHQIPVDPADALYDLLATIAVVRRRQIPRDPDARAAAWRSYLSGRRLLLVLDDAASSRQIRPLLPGAGRSMVLMTSRGRLADLEAVSVSLAELTSEEASTLLVGKAGRDDVSIADPAVTELADLCGGLPLGVALIGRQLHHHPARSPADIAADLAKVSDKTDFIRSGTSTLKSAFDLSYRDLPARQQQLFRRLSLHPGRDFDCHVAAALADTGAERAGNDLEDLYGQQLIAESGNRRYQFHDLIRQYATTLADAEQAAERDAAIDRLLAYYRRTAERADYLLSPAPRRDDGPRRADLTTRQQAADWMETERANLHAAASLAARAGRLDYAVAIPAAMAGYLSTRGYWEQGVVLHHIAADAAVRLQDIRAEARSLANLGVLQRQMADLPDAASTQHKALALCRRSGDEPGEAAALTQMGWISYLTDNFDQAASELTAALDLCRRHGDRPGEARALTHLGYVQLVTCDLTACAANLGTAVEISRELADADGEAKALSYLAGLQRQLGQYADGITSLSRAAKICAELGDQNNLAGNLTDLGYLQQITGDLTAAIDTLTEAVRLYQQVGNPFGKAAALNYLGLAQRLNGRPAEAMASQLQAITSYEEHGSRIGTANSLQEIGLLQQAEGEFVRARETQQRALDLYRAVPDKNGEAETLNNLGGLLMDCADRRGSRTFHEQALRVAREIGSPFEEARALEGIGLCHLMARQPDLAEPPLASAQAIYERLQSPNARRVAGLMAQPPR
jgi:tetratricopeptide (TPR) repeat protein/transcriptional regulator with XRE-family HTH domain